MTLETDRDSIIRRLQGLQSKTIENGCTESEALSAAKAISRIMTEYGLAMSDIEIQERKDCESDVIETGRKRNHPIVSSIMAIAEFCDCKCWQSTGRQIRYNFFGFPEDVESAKWLYHVIKSAMDYEASNYRRECLMEGLPTGRTQSTSFLRGMSSRINKRLRDMKAEQNIETRETTGRDLVLVKSATVESSYANLGLRLKNDNNQRSRTDSGAYGAGQAAGERVGFNRGVNYSTTLIG